MTCRESALLTKPTDESGVLERHPKRLQRQLEAMQSELQTELKVKASPELRCSAVSACICSLISQLGDWPTAGASQLVWAPRSRKQETLLTE